MHDSLIFTTKRYPPWVFRTFQWQMTSLCLKLATGFGTCIAAGVICVALAMMGTYFFMGAPVNLIRLALVILLAYPVVTMAFSVVMLLVLAISFPGFDNWPFLDIVETLGEEGAHAEVEKAKRSCWEWNFAIAPWTVWRRRKEFLSRLHR